MLTSTDFWIFVTTHSIIPFPCASVDLTITSADIKSRHLNPTKYIKTISVYIAGTIHSHVYIQTMHTKHIKTHTHEKAMHIDRIKKCCTHIAINVIHI